MGRLEGIIIPAKFLILICHLLSCIVIVNTSVIIIELNNNFQHILFNFI